MTVSVGELLRQARQARGLDIELAAQALRVRVRYLEALESGDWESLPSITQGRGFLRVYAEYLKLDAAPLLAEVSGGKPSVPPPSVYSSPPQASPSPAAREQADVIFRDLGAQLRQQREVLGLSLDDVERQTRLRSFYLSAIEEGRIQDLPSSVQGRGMLHNYATFLGCDPDPLLLRFADGLQAQLSARQAATRQASAAGQPANSARLAPPAWLRRFFSADILVGGFLVVFFVGFLIWGAQQVLRTQTTQAEATQGPSISEALIGDDATPDPANPQAQASATPLAPGGLTVSTSPAGSSGEPSTSAEATPTATSIPGSGSNKPLQLYLVVRQRAWARVIVDGQVEFEGRVSPGSAYIFAGNQRIELLTGNGAALQVVFNQADLGVVGILGEVVSRIFTLEGMQTPTPTITPLIPTATPTIPPPLLGTQVAP